MFKYLSMFKKLSNIIITYPPEDDNDSIDSETHDIDRYRFATYYNDFCGKLCMEMIKNNKDNITSFTSIADPFKNKIVFPTERLNDLTDCTHLQELEISSVKISNRTNAGDCSNNTNTNNNDNNKLANLKKLSLKNTIIDMSLFRSLLELNIIKLETLILDHLKIIINSQEIENNTKIDIDPNFLDIKHITLGKSNCDWHYGLLNNLNKKTQKMLSGSKLESVELNVCQMTKKRVLANNGFNKMKNLKIKSVTKHNAKNGIFNALASVGCLQTLNLDDDKEDDCVMYTSDIETLEIDSAHISDNFGMIACLKILNKIKFNKLQSLILNIDYKRHHKIYSGRSELDYFNDLLRDMNIIDQFVTVCSNNQFKCIDFKYRNHSYSELYGYHVTFGTSVEPVDSSEIDDKLNKKIEWDKISNIISKWCNYNNTYNPNTKKDHDWTLIFELFVRVYVDLGSGMNVSGNALCEKMKWINTMVNSLCISENTIDCGDIISNSSVASTVWDSTREILDFDVQLSKSVKIRGTIEETKQRCRFEMAVVVKLL